MRLEHRKLALEAQHRRRDQRLPRQHAGIGDEEAGGEIVGAVADQVVGPDQRQGIGGGEPGLVGLHRHQRIDRPRGGGGVVDLGLADPGGGMGDLALQVGEIEQIVVNQADGADPGRGQIEQQRAAEPAGADDQHPGLTQFGLSDAADLGEQDMAGIAPDLVRIEIEVHARDMASATTRTKASAKWAGMVRLGHE